MKRETKTDTVFNQIEGKYRAFACRFLINLIVKKKYQFIKCRRKTNLHHMIITLQMIALDWWYH